MSLRARWAKAAGALTLALMLLVGALALRGLPDRGGGGATSVPAGFSGGCTPAGVAAGLHGHGLGSYSEVLSNAASKGYCISH